MHTRRLSPAAMLCTRTPRRHSITALKRTRFVMVMAAGAFIISDKRHDVRVEQSVCYKLAKFAGARSAYTDLCVLCEYARCL